MASAPGPAGLATRAALWGRGSALFGALRPADGGAAADSVRTPSSGRR